MTGRLARVVLCVAAAWSTAAWGQRRPPRHRDAGTRPPPRDASADVRTLPATHGTLGQSAVQRVLGAHREDLRACYATALQRDPSLHGEVVVRLRIEPDGTVSETSSGGDPTMRRVGACMEGVLRRATFPRPTGGAATVSAPFLFAPGE